MKCLYCENDLPESKRVDANFCDNNCRRKYKRQQDKLERETIAQLVDMSDMVMRIQTLNGVLQCDPVTARRLEAMGYG